MATIEVIVVDNSNKIIPNVRINGSYESKFGALLGKVGSDYKVYSAKTGLDGKCRFHVNKDFYIWFGVVSRTNATSISVKINNTQQNYYVTLKLEKKVEEYKVEHIFNFIDLDKKNIPSESAKNQLLYRISKDSGKTWQTFMPLTNPLLVDSHVGEIVTVKLYTMQDKYDILKETGKNHYTASKYQSLGENFLDKVIVPIKYINTKTGQNKPMTAKQEEKFNNKCLSGFENCPCQTVKFSEDGYMNNSMVDTTDRIAQTVTLETPVAILLHRTEGWSAKSSINSGRSNKAVAHFYVCSGLNGMNSDGSFKTLPSDGKIYQVLPINKKSNHMGSAPFPATVAAKIGNHNTLSIEVSGRYLNGKWHDLSDKQAKSTACLLTALMRKYQLGYEKVHFHEDLCAKTDYEGRLVWISIKKYLKNPPKGQKPAIYRPHNKPFTVINDYPNEI